MRGKERENERERERENESEKRDKIREREKTKVRLLPTVVGGKYRLGCCTWKAPKCTLCTNVSGLYNLCVVDRNSCVLSKKVECGQKTFFIFSPLFFLRFFSLFSLFFLPQKSSCTQDSSSHFPSSCG